MMQQREDAKTQKRCTGCTNAVPVMWLPAGQSLQTLAILAHMVTMVTGANANEGSSHGDMAKAGK